MQKASMAEQQKSREQEHRELMGTAQQVAPGQSAVVMPGTPADYFFPWEQSQYHANGSTSAEKNK